ncbi:glycosyltransferase, group 1 family [Legionella lansingensis]|uniref:Glycosyltransferase, group 1 family n=1 Tax=Legionella lansingensis TaxID=45067 RepID=A0A0W0VWF5_9GAMM|nr:glycosyltransferase family 4 protein [Legionella lansingensis]KTD24337.1 glycosyltransferase, group 1 family [Legionella lansingensis]SNV51749.1 glycosyltransferase, group 1 family [Legionella lansingensis]
MNILLVSQYFWPESFIINELTHCLVMQGHTVEVLTGKPNYPDGDIFKGYAAKGCTTEYFNEKVAVHRVPIFPRGKGGGRRLLLNYLSFVLSGLFYFHRLIKLRQFDVIFVFAPSPITSAIPAIYLKKRLKLPFVLWVQDLWPESLSATGFIKNHRILRFVGKLVRWIYASADMLLVQSQGFAKPVSQYALANKIVYYPNSYLDKAPETVEEELIPNDLLLQLERNCCLVFAGNLGTAQSLPTIVQAAERLKHLSDCKLILIGSGSMSEWIARQIVEKGLNNLILAGRFPSSVMPHLFSRAAGLLVTLKREEIFTYTIPSKIQAYLAAGRPVIAALDGEGARIVQEAGAGFASPAEDEITLAKNIERLYHMSNSERDKLGQSGRAYFLEHFEMVRQSQRLIEILKERISKKETS